MSIKVLGFIGKKSSGKNTAFDLLKGRNIPLQEFSFAGKLKKVCSHVFNIPLEYFLNESLKEQELDIGVDINQAILAELALSYGIPFSEIKYKLGVEHTDKFVINKAPLKTPRQILQFVGTDVLRKYDPLIHIKALLDTLPANEIIGVTDIRFPNEFTFLLNTYGKDFIPIYMERPTGSKDIHSSETSFETLKEYSLVIHNNGTIRQLEEELVERILPFLKKE
ncbi:MAG: hypothetical protein MOGMAGMI_00365 [Candidatus Omnitrophica bacterium]|nr:hypothetical protein [Candidatus Omnitrophota bacterium]